MIHFNFTIDPDYYQARSRIILGIIIMSLLWKDLDTDQKSNPII